MPAKSRNVIGVVGIVIIALLSGGWFLYSRHAAKPRYLVLSGALEARTVMVGSLSGGRVAAVFVDEGSIVKPGQRIAVLETQTIDHQLSEQNAAIDTSRAQLARVLAGNRTEEVEQAKIVAENDAREKSRFARLFREGIVSKESYDAHATQAGTSAAQLRLLQKGARPEDVATARAEVAQQEARLATLLRQRAETDILASVSGVVQSIKVRPGDLVAPGQGVAELLEQNQLWVRIYVPETMLGAVHIGAPVTVYTDTDPHRPFRGRVAQVSSQGEYTPRNIQTRAQRAEEVFGVKVVVDPDPALKAGMAATVDLGVRIPAL